ncbi:MAG: DUF5691 domain-containing protein, partial [Solirubrobacteraceae bacterium]|nr:DUF5691 domain-containing protein [Solirubrobacteraceae bacterium]
LAGQVDPTALPKPAAPETLPPCPPGAVTLLRRVLSDAESRAVLPEWIDRVSRRAERAPAALVPDLLDAGNADRDLRASVLRVTGHRGPWLAAQHPAWWSWAVPRMSGGVPAGSDEPEPVSEIDPLAAASPTWQFGAFDQRLADLEGLRAIDPSAARAMVESTWDQDQPAQRAQFLTALRTGLGEADEPLLERALADRRQEVRLEAATLLTALPSSGYRSRMARRLRPLVSMRGTLRPQLVVELPGELDAAGKRDGLRAKGREGLGPRSALLAELVAGAGLAPWTGTLTSAKKPADAIALAVRSDHGPALLSGWRVAARRERDPAWLAALAIHDGNPELLAELDPADAVPAVLELLERHPHHVWQAVSALAGPWPETISHEVLRRLGSEAALPVDRPLQRLIASRLHPTSFLPALDMLGRRAAGGASLDALGLLIELRQSLIRELPTA